MIQCKLSNQVTFVKCKRQKHHMIIWNDDSQGYCTSLIIRHLLQQEKTPWFLCSQYKDSGGPLGDFPSLSAGSKRNLGHRFQVNQVDYTGLCEFSLYIQKFIDFNLKSSCLFFLEIRQKARKMVNGNGLGKAILMLQAKLSAHLNQHSTYSFRELCRLVKAQNLAIIQPGETMINS